jgi:hypothetical protein
MRKLVILFSVFFLVLGLSSTATALEGIVDVEIDESDTSDEITEAEVGDNVDINIAVTGDNEIYEPDVKIVIDPETALKLDLENAYMSLDGINWVKYGSDDNLFINEYSSIHLPNFVYEYAPGKYHWDLNSLGYYTSETEYKFTGTAWLKIPAEVMSTGMIKVDTTLVDDERPTSPGNNDEGLVLDVDTTTLTGIAADENTDPNTNPNEITESTISAATNTVPMQNTGAPAIPAVLGLLAIIGGALYTRLR